MQRKNLLDVAVAEFWQVIDDSDFIIYSIFLCFNPIDQPGLININDLLR